MLAIFAARRRRTGLLLAGLLPALAALAPTAARANDRDLRGTTVPAASCVEHSRGNTDGTNIWTRPPWTHGPLVMYGFGDG